jgi:tRNA(fMet)-specific endonuclease VapC
MGILIDTSLLVSMERDEAVIRRLEAATVGEPAAISVISLSELLHGVYRASPRHQGARLAAIERIVGLFEAISITPAIARVHASLWADLARRGETVGLHDLWIGASAISHDWPVATRDLKDFGRIPGLEVISLPA